MRFLDLPMPKLTPVTERTTYVPAKADLFMLKFRNGDRSWQTDVFICLDSDGRIVVCEMVAGSDIRRGKPYTFMVDEMNFYATSRDRAILMGAEI